MGAKNLLQNSTKVMGVEESIFNEIVWKQDAFIMPIVKPINNLIPAKTIFFDFDFDTNTNTLKSGSSYFHNLIGNSGTLSVLYKNENGSAINTNKPYWDGVLKINDKFIEIDNLVLKTKKHGHDHTHQVLKNLSFQDIGIQFHFKLKNGGDNYYHINLPAPRNYKSYVGVEGVKNQKINCQLGMKQLYLYYIKIGEKYIGIKLELSVVLMYASNDFEPLGVIDAAKIFPQAKFTSSFIDVSDLELYPIENEILYPNQNPNYNYIDLYNSLPLDVDLSTVSVHSYKARVKMTANNNNSQHVDLRDNGSGELIDYNYFKQVREAGMQHLIPSFLEKYFNPNLKNSNLPGLFTDSNSSHEDNRKFPLYHMYGAILPPTWAFIFDYAKTNIQQEKEIQATYGFQDIEITNDKLKKRRRLYKYPKNNIGDKMINLTKVERQGEYDNIHFHGYMGNYADNNLPVIHAPICGFCCFHLHWRWAKLNYDLNTSKLFKVSGLGKGDANRFNGWDTKGINDGSGFGYPLIPPNQSLKIAITNENKIPSSIDRVVSLNGNPEVLNKDIKAIWYSADILNIQNVYNGSYVVLEQGAGFAFQYSSDVERIFNWAKNILDILKEISTAGNPILPPELKPFLDLTDALLVPEDNFEIVYRIMRVFNNVPLELYPNLEQVPQGDYKPDSTKPSMEKL